MATLVKQFAVVFFIGFIIFAIALGLGGMAGGQVLSPNPNLLAFRYLGGGLMAGGLALWIASRRSEGGKPGLNPLIVMLVAAGLVVLVIAAITPVSTIALLGPAGLAANVSALVVGFLAMLISPATGAKPISRTWPEGGEQPVTAHAPAADASSHVTPDAGHSH